MGGPAVLTLREVARYLNVHPNTVYRLAQRGLLPAFKVGSDWRFNRESIDHWRLAQEHSFAETIPQQSPSLDGLKNEVLHIVHWYLTEGLNNSVPAAEVGLFMESAVAAVKRELNRLTREGLLARKKAGAETRYSLTPQGLARACQLFGGGRARIAGHASVVEFELQRNAEGRATLKDEISGLSAQTEMRK